MLKMLQRRAVKRAAPGLCRSSKAAYREGRHDAAHSTLYHAARRRCARYYFEMRYAAVGRSAALAKRC